MLAEMASIMNPPELTVRRLLRICHPQDLATQGGGCTCARLPRGPGEIGGLQDGAGPLVLDEGGEAEIPPVPRWVDLEREAAGRGGFAVELDELVHRSPRGK